MKLFLAILLVVASSVSTDAAPAFSKLALKVGDARRGAYKSVPSAASDKLYFVNNNQVFPGNMSLYEYDVSTKSHKVITDQINGVYSGLSGSAVCGDYFYYFGTLAPQKWALVKVGLNSGSIEYLSQNADFLLHKIVCDPTGKNGTTILAVKSSMSGPLTFSVVRYDTATGSISTIGSFPQGLDWLGLDTLFSFDLAKNECWGTFVMFDSNYKITGAQLYKIQLTNGVVSPATAFDGVKEDKVPYQLFPGNSGNLMGFIRNQQSAIAKLCSFHEGSDGISFDSCKTMPNVNNGGIPDPICGTKYYYTNGGLQPGVPQGLYVLDLETQTSTKVDDLGNFVPNNYVGAMAGVGCI